MSKTYKIKHDVYLDDETSKTIKKAFDCIGMSISQGYKYCVLETIKNMHLEDKTVQKNLKKVTQRLSFLEASNEKTMHMNYLHQVPNAFDVVFNCAGRSLAQTGEVNYYMITHIKKLYLPVFRNLPLKEKKIYKEEIKFFKNIDKEENLQNLFQNKVDAYELSLERVARKLKFPINIRSVEFKKKYKVVKSEKIEDV